MANRSHDGEQQFEPGPSFTDDVPANEALNELPSWLRSFAETTQEPEPAETDHESADAPDLQADDGDDSDNPSLPGWLSSDRPVLRPHAGNAEPTVGHGFFSEDDLPEWLRALNSDDSQGSSPGPRIIEGGLQEPQARGTSSQVLTVPAVSNVWVTGLEDRADSAGAALFATIASGGASRPDVLAPTLPDSGPQPVARKPESRAADVPSSGSQRRSRWSRRERILLIAIIVLSVVLLIMLSGNVGS